LTCSNTFTAGSIVYQQCHSALHHRQTDDSIMPIADHAVCGIVRSSESISLHQIFVQVFHRYPYHYLHLFCIIIVGKQFLL